MARGRRRRRLRGEIPRFLNPDPLGVGAKSGGVMVRRRGLDEPSRTRARLQTRQRLLRVFKLLAILPAALLPHLELRAEGLLPGLHRISQLVQLSARLPRLRHRHGLLLLGISQFCAERRDELPRLLRLALELHEASLRLLLHPLDVDLDLPSQLVEMLGGARRDSVARIVDVRGQRNDRCVIEVI